MYAFLVVTFYQTSKIIFDLFSTPSLKRSFPLNEFVIKSHAVAEQTFAHGAFHGAMTGLLYGATATGIHYLYQRKSLKLFLIDASYIVAFLALSGGVMAALHLG